jgi:transcription initiation factor TFIIIB Brf1 subunit/transcription initiation factor TFIIB
MDRRLHIRDDCERLGKDLGLSDEHVVWCADHAGEVDSGLQLSNYSSALVAGAMIYFTSRMKGDPRTASQVARLIDGKYVRHKLMALYKIIARTADMQVRVTLPTDVMEDICDQLEVPLGVRHLIFERIERLVRSDDLCNRSPDAVVGAVILKTCRENGIQMSMTELLTVVAAARTTVYACLRHID